MNRKRILVFILAGIVVALLAWQFHHSPEWRNFSWSAVWTATQNAEGWYIVGSVVLIYASYVIRAWRWQGLMEPGGRFWPVLKGTVIGFTGTALLGRAGELVRPYYIARKHRMELSPQLSVWLLERVFDMFGIVLLLSLDLGLSPRIHALTRDAGYAHAFHKAGILMGIGIAILIVLLYVFHLRASHLLARLRPRPGEKPRRVRRRVAHFLQALADGLAALTNAARLLQAVCFTILLWIVVALSIWAAVRAYPAMLPGFSFTEGVLLMTLTAVGAVATLPAVGGGFQVLTIFGLVQVFGADSAAATSAALVIWLVCFYAVAPFGAALATHEGVSWRGIEQAAYATEAAEEH